MPYASETDIEAIIAQSGDVGAGTAPNTTQVASILDQVAGEMNACLSARSIPVPFVSDGSGAQAAFATYLLAVNAWGAAAQVLKSRYPDTVGPDETPAYAYWEKKYQQALAALKGGFTIPSTVTSAVDAGANVAPTTYNVQAPDDDIDLGSRAQPAFSRQMSRDW